MYLKSKPNITSYICLINHFSERIRLRMHTTHGWGIMLASALDRGREARVPSQLTNRAPLGPRLINHQWKLGGLWWRGRSSPARNGAFFHIRIHLYVSILIRYWCCKAKSIYSMWKIDFGCGQINEEEEEEKVQCSYTAIWLFSYQPLPYKWGGVHFHHCNIRKWRKEILKTLPLYLVLPLLCSWVCDLCAWVLQTDFLTTDTY